MCRWFGANARPMPWRIEPRDPYLSLVSEFMLQQTQVARVLERLPAFIRRFPTVAALARAEGHEVLAAWSGMGYYRRATNLHAAARVIVERHGGRVPDDVEALRALPGVGRYTAGAVASIAFGRAEPAVDGNVTRVLLRLEGRALRHGSAEALRWAWGRAGALVSQTQSSRAAERQNSRLSLGAGSLNEGLMELGATACGVGRPRCGACPLRELCVARARGMQDQIPRAQAPARRSRLWCGVVVVRDGRGRMLVERRGAGLWEGMWQAPTVEAKRKYTVQSAKYKEERPAVDAVVDRLGLVGVALAEGAPEEFDVVLSHREVRFTVWRGRTREAGGALAREGRRWVTREALREMALANPQRRMLIGEAGERS